MVKVKLKSGYEIYLDGKLVPSLDTLVYNLPKDWDFIILITGDRMVRTGKSVMAMNICAYLADKLGTKYSVDNVYFDSKTMIDAALKAPKNTVFHYDEAREGLAAIKTMSAVQQNLIDFFNECGQLNHIFVLVMPDFFSMKEEIAIGRSEMLFNVYRRSTHIMKDLYKSGTKIPLIRFDRGFFEMFNRKLKSKLFDMSRVTRRKTYQLVKATLNGRFTDYYPLDREKYDKRKEEALQRFQERKEEEKFSSRKTDVFRDKIIMDLKAKGLTAKKISSELEQKWEYQISRRRIDEILQANAVLEGGRA